MSCEYTECWLNRGAKQCRGERNPETCEYGKRKKLELEVQTLRQGIWRVIDEVEKVNPSAKMGAHFDGWAACIAALRASFGVFSDNGVPF